VSVFNASRFEPLSPEIATEVGQVYRSPNPLMCDNIKVSPAEAARGLTATVPLGVLVDLLNESQRLRSMWEGSSINEVTLEGELDAMRLARDQARSELESFYVGYSKLREFKQPIEDLEVLRRAGWNVYLSMGSAGYSVCAHPQAIVAIGGDNWIKFVSYGKETPTLAGTVDNLLGNIERMGERICTPKPEPQPMSANTEPDDDIPF
jgi:hypothetical protein